MKKFFMFSPYQKPETFKSGIYRAVDNPALQLDKAVHFPLLPIIHAQAQEGDSIEVYVICADYEYAKRNLELFSQELDALCDEMNVEYKLIAPGFDGNVDYVPYDDRLDTQLIIFEQLIQRIADNDILSVCTSYGSKACPMVMMLALKYAYRMHKNVAIGYVGYGSKDFSESAGTDNLRIYDVTSLFYMDAIVQNLAEQKAENPKEIIRLLLQ